MKNKDKPINQLAASLLGKSLVDLFPGAKLLGGAPTALGFAYELEYFGAIPNDLIDYVEQRMNQASKSEDEVRCVEMMRENAANLFTHHNQPILAELVLDDPSNIVSLLKIGPFYDYCDESVDEITLKNIPTDLSSLKAIRLIELTHHDGVIRVEGVLGESQKELRQFIKKYRKYQETSFKKLASELKLMTSDEEPVWLPNGINLQDIIINWWKEEYKAQGFEIVRSPVDLNKIFNYLNQFPFKIAGYEGDDLAHIYCKKEDIAKEVISSLQFFAKMINIFRVDAYWVIKTPKLKSSGYQGFVKRNIEIYKDALADCGFEVELEEFSTLPEGPVLTAYFVDSIGREWDGPALWVKQISDERFLVSRKLFGPFEQFVTLIVEQSAGRLPIWLTPDSLHAITLKNAEHESEKKLKKS